MLEKRLIAVPIQAFTADGTVAGQIKVADSSLFKVKQEVVVIASGQPNLTLEIKRIDDINTMSLGPKGGSITSFQDMSNYTVTATASIYANEQKRPSVPSEEINRAVYEEEPTVALRTMLVDKMGDKYSAENPLPVQLSDGQINIGSVNAELEVQLSHKDNDPNTGDVHDSVRIGDGENQLAINPDGSLNINIVQSATAAPPVQTFYREIAAVAAGIETNLITVTTLLSDTRVYKIDVSGDNIAIYKLKLNGNTLATKRTGHTRYNDTFSFEPFTSGLQIVSGDTLVITVTHSRPTLGNFEATAITS